jgi:hypothetical protein
MFLMTDNKWARLLAFVSGLVNQKLLLQNELSVVKTSSTYRINNLGASRNIVTGPLPRSTCNGV